MSTFLCVEKEYHIPIKYPWFLDIRKHRLQECFTRLVICVKTASE